VARVYKHKKMEKQLTSLFTDIYKEKFVKVIVVPELRTLDYCLLKKKEFKGKV
jgi:hypothetical protein